MRTCYVTYVDPGGMIQKLNPEAKFAETDGKELYDSFFSDLRKKQLRRFVLS